MTKRHSTRGGLAAAAAALVVTACSGPAQQVEVDVRGELAPLSLDAANTAASAVTLPPYVNAGSAGPPANWTVNPQIADEAAPPEEGSAACPFTDPRMNVDAALEAPTAPPAETAYGFFAEGQHQSVSTDGGQRAVMPAQMTRTVQNVRWGSGGASYDFDMVVEAAHGTTTTTYRVVLNDDEVVRPDVPRPINVGEPPESLDPSAYPPVVGTTRVATPAQPGMYIMSMATQGADPVRFNDGLGMLIVRWPAYSGNTFHGQATVGTGDQAQHIAYTSTVQDDGVVEACGTRLDSIAVQVSATVAPATSNGPAASVDATYNIATQYGGLIIADRVVTSVGSDATSSVERTIAARIKGEPQPAGQPRPAQSCPANGSGPPQLAAGERIDTPPVEATYRMQTPSVGQAVSVYEINGVTPDAGKFPTTLMRTVRNVQWTGTEYFEYETVDDIGGSTTVTKYRVVPGPADSDAAPAKQPEPGAPGMYLVSTTSPDGQTVTYNEGAGMLIVPFPVDGSAAAQYVTRGSDGTGDVVAASYVSPNTVVEVCGTRIEGWTVDVVISPGSEPAPKPEPPAYVDTRLLPPEEPPLPEATTPPPEPPRPQGPTAGPRSQLELMRSYTDLLHDQGHVQVSHALTIAPALGGLALQQRSTVSSVGRVETFQQNLAYALASEPEVP